MPFIGKIGFVKNKPLMFALINYILTVNLFLVNYTVASSRVCRKLKHGLEESARYESVQDADVNHCPPSSAPFSVYSIPSGNSSKGEQVLLVCWVKDINRFALQFEDSIHVDDVISVPGIQIHSCVNTNDTIFYRRRYKYGGTFNLLLKPPVTKDVPFKFRAYYSHNNKGVYYSHRRVLQYKHSGEIVNRSKRNADYSVQFTPSSECGETRNCFRNGAEDCNHFECTYFISYNTTDSVVDIELSARTSGWVAVGFSSDTKMGGDEVIVCQKTRSDAVKSGSYKNQYSHQDPTVMGGENIVTLNSFQIKDGHIYCHVSRPLSVRLSVHQDLSNDWHQLYAYGPLSSGGDLEKHSFAPLVSRKLSVLQKSNIVTSGTARLTASIITVNVLAYYCHVLMMLT